MLRFKTLALVCMGALASMTGCENLTAAPVCNEANEVVFEGISGAYYMATLDEEFNRTVDFIYVTSDAKNKTHFKVNSKKRNMEIDLIACRIGANDIIEAYHPNFGLYSQAKLTVTNVGLQFSPFYYDRAQLSELGIATSFLEYGEQSLAKRLFNFEGNARSMIIENTKIDGKALLPLSVQGPYSVNLIRR